MYTTTPTFYWWIGANTSSITYTVQIKEQGSARYKTLADDLVDQFFYTTASTLIPGKVYDWKVTASSTVVSTPVESTVGTLTISPSLGTGNPVASWPVGNASVYSLTPALYWYMNGNLTGIDHFRIAWKPDTTSDPINWDNITGSDSSDPGAVTVDDSLTSCLTAALKAGTHYRWAVAGFDAGNNLKTVWSEGSFSTIGGIGSGRVVLSAPTGGGTVSSLTPTLYWWFNGANANIKKYCITYSRNENFETGSDTFGDFTKTFITSDASISVTLEESLVPGATYYWKVKASANGTDFLNETESKAASFVASPGSGCVVPLVGSPVKDVVLNSNSATFSWVIPIRSSSTLTYDVERSTDPDMSSALTYKGLKKANVEVTGLEKGKIYFWRVRSVNDKGQYSSYSDIARFSVMGTTGVKEQVQIVPKEFSLLQNYPNPFNPTTEIQFGLSENGYTSLKIYNILGREIRTLLNGTKQAGTYTLNWDGRDNNGNAVQSGTYIQTGFR